MNKMDEQISVIISVPQKIFHKNSSNKTLATYEYYKHRLLQLNTKVMQIITKQEKRRIKYQN